MRGWLIFQTQNLLAVLTITLMGWKSCIISIQNWYCDEKTDKKAILAWGKVLESNSCEDRLTGS